MPDVLVLRNSILEGPGRLGNLLHDDGFEVDMVDAWREPIPKGDYTLVVILGGPESANDPLPYLEAEQQLIRDRTKAGSPVLGICLGAQLIARALGARVYRGPKKEIGYYGDLRAASPAGLFAGFDDPFAAFHWHGDTFDLPDGAVRLASSGTYPNQAFLCGSAVGLQFHLESDGDMVRAWLERAPDAPDDPGSTLSEIGAREDAVLSNLGRFYSNYKSAFLH